jgi:hypothetical protein
MQRQSNDVGLFPSPRAHGPLSNGTARILGFEVIETPFDITGRRPDRLGHDPASLAATVKSPTPLQNLHPLLFAQNSFFSAQIGNVQLLALYNRLVGSEKPHSSFPGLAQIGATGVVEVASSRPTPIAEEFRTFVFQRAYSKRIVRVASREEHQGLWREKGQQG